MDNKIENVQFNQEQSSAPPYATIIDIVPAEKYIYDERNIKSNEIMEVNKNILRNEINNYSNILNNIKINPISCIKFSCKSLLFSIFITLFIYETDDITRKDLLYYILLSIIAIGNK